MRSSPTFIRKQITSDDKKTHTLNRFQNIVIFPKKVNQNSETRWEKKNVHPIIQQHIEPHL